MGNVVVPLTMLAGGAALVYVGITNPAGGVFAGLGDLLHGTPDTTAKPSSLVDDLAGVAAAVNTGAGSVVGAGFASAADTSQVRAAVLTEAHRWLGVPYVFGGNTMAGVDCSGFTLQVYARAAGVHLPRVSYLQAKRGRRTLSPQPGDLVAFGSPVHHVGIYIGGGQIVHAPHTGTVVRTEAIWHTEPVQYRDILGGRTKTKTTKTKTKRTKRKRSVVHT